MNNDKMNGVEFSKYIGVFIDYGLKWENNVQIKIIITNIWKQWKGKIYLHYIMLSLTACSDAYSNILRNLQNIQNKIFKIIVKTNFMLLL